MENMGVEFKSFYNNKKVLITGHTGFKGSWLCSILLELGAKVCGIGLEPNTTPALFNLLNLDEKIESHIVNIRNFEEVYNRKSIPLKWLQDNCIKVNDLDILKYIKE